MTTHATSSAGTTTTYKPGDVVVYPAHGIGEIQGIEIKEAGAHRTPFYVLKILETGAKVMVSVAAAGGVFRPVMSASAAAEVLDVLRAPGVATNAQPWTRRHRIYTEMLKSGAPDAVAKVLRDMSRLRHDKDLSFAERKLLDQAKGMLLGELSAAIGKTRPAMEKDIEAMFAAPPAASS